MFEHEPLSAGYAQRVIDERCETVRQKMIDECPSEWRTYVISRVAIHRRQVAKDASQGGQRYKSSPARTPKTGRYIAPDQCRGNSGVAASAIAKIRAALNPTTEVHQ
ncbi:hypothetical protein LGQ10_29705 [Pseudomonas sp. L5B5]|uniref:hypothetical protein n=1 Tax=Pseudomonas sp. L5B5 TaxID=2883205 RepID=UPI001CFA2F9F|nr:hypothetical protein [Pseudomonas sp. L5B5]UCZ84440.1 hypothetical protein LGQ10_29705 [Pseudomonas sp. L5B5]